MTQIKELAIEYDKKLIRALGQYKMPQANYYYTKLHTLTELDKELKKLPGITKVREFFKSIRQSDLY